VLSVHSPPELLNGGVTTTRGRTLDEFSLATETLNGVPALVDPAPDSSDDDSSVGLPPLMTRHHCDSSDDFSSDDDFSVGLSPLLTRRHDDSSDDDSSVDSPSFFVSHSDDASAEVCAQVSYGLTFAPEWFFPVVVGDIADRSFVNGGDEASLVQSISSQDSDAASTWYDGVDVLEDEDEDDVEVEWVANCCELRATISEGDEMTHLTFIMTPLVALTFLLWKLIVGGLQYLF
jgi:hypothetical protein